MNRKKTYRNISLTFLVLAAFGHLAAPAFLGFSVLPLAMAFIAALAAGPKQWRADFAALTSPAGRNRFFAVLFLILSLGLALAAGRADLGQPVDFSRNRAVALAPETINLLTRLDKPVSLTVNLGPQSPQILRVKNLLEHYQQKSGGRINITYINPQIEAADDGLGPRLVKPNTALIEAENFRENISPISEDTVNGALARLLHPERRLIFFLNTFGEKMVQDKGPGGLSQWAADLSDRRFLAQDYYWAEGAALPREASALVIAGPRAPLGEEREKMLLEYLKNGGKLMIMADPLTVAISPDFWLPFGLKYPDGLVIDPETTLAGTDEVFVVSQDFPAHPLTRGLASPVVWPVAGAFITAASDGHNELDSTIYALSQSSMSSWLERDAASFANKNVRYQKDEDLPGPLALAVATELKNGGRLLALADSDLAANGFLGFPGNRNFSSAAVNWLLDGDTVPLKIKDETQGLILSHISARLIFWLPVIGWPLAAIIVWLFFHLRRRRRRGA
ncbi:GldG family protein [Deltaproteobacteria bacterium OttesenSCG-928-K17]|nr:GldG family protein [Deltaproteobacteria bacterium OttesenSCG-928-K17]